jgi:hypothetical protein
VIAGKLLAGEYPCSLYEEEARVKISNLLGLGIDWFLDLIRAGELVPYEPRLKELAAAGGQVYQYTRSEIIDFGIPTVKQMRSILDGIDRAVLENHRVYLHCWGGVGRTGAVVGCFLVRHGLNGMEALAKLERLRQVIPAHLRRPSPESPDQYAIVLNWKVGTYGSWMALIWTTVSVPCMPSPRNFGSITG